MALEGRALDLVEIDAASNRGIDDIRELREKVAYSPSEARYRVYIVDEAHELTAPAWDAFLKTLEEPPPHAIFVLATTEAHKVPATIVSRCQHFDFRRIRPGTIKTRLLEIASQEKLQLEVGAAERLARMARGGLRDAISLLDQAASFTAGKVDLDALRDVLGLSDTRAIQQLVEAFSEARAPAALEVLLQASEEGADLRLFADDLASYLRGLLLATVGSTRGLRGEFSEEQIAWLEQQAKQWQPDALMSLLRAITEGLVRIRDSGQFKLHLELAILEACASQPVGAEPALSLPKGLAPPKVLQQEPVATEPALPKVEPVGAGLAPTAPVSDSDNGLGDRRPEAAEATVDSSDSESGPADPHQEPAVVEPHAPLATGDFNLDLARERWPQVVDWVAERKPLVASYLRPAEVRDWRDGCLSLGFPFKLHHERIAEIRNRELVENAFREVVGQAISLRCELVPAQPGDPRDLDPDDDPVLKHALQRFGGRAELLE
jgi:DNA polymerase-3 subunit gamma/tau